MGEKRTDIWSRIYNLDSRIIWWSLLIVIVVALLVPFFLPINIGRETQGFYDTVQGLKPGDKVLFSCDSSASILAELRPPIKAVITHLFRVGAKVVLIGLKPDCTIIWNAVLDPPEAYGKEYGVDIVNLGFIPGLESATAALAKDFRSLVTKDYYGTPLDDLDLMKGTDKAEDFKLLINVEDADFYLLWLRQWQTPFGINYCVVSPAMAASAIQPFFASGQVKGIAIGTTGSAQYETLIGVPGEGIKTANLLSLTHLLVIAFIVIGNVGYLVSKRRGGVAK